MSLFGGRRASPPAIGRARSQTATAANDESGAPPPHFQPAATDLPTVDEAHEVADQLRLLLSELETRELSLQRQLALVEREQRDLRDNARQFTEAQQALEVALTEREASIELQAAAAAEQQATVDQQQAELDRRRAELREELWAEVAEQRQEIAEGQAALETGEIELAQLRDRLREALLADVAADRSQLAGLRADLGQERTRLRIEIESELDSQRQALAEERAGLEQQRLRLREGIEAELAEQRTEGAALQQELAGKQADFDAETARWQATRDQDWKEQLALLEQRRHERLADIEDRDTAVSQREVDLVKRTRFQEEHLARVRTAIEAKQTDLERSRAAIFVWSADVETSLCNRLAHLRKFRELLEQREAACDAAWQSLADARMGQQEILNESREQLAAERSVLEEQQQVAIGDLRRHADLLRLREADVARQSARFEQWEQDLERRSREWTACEAALQLAIDTLSDQVGAAVVRRLLAQAAPPVDCSVGADELSAELLTQERQLEDWRDELQRERNAFAEMTAARDERLRVRESALIRQLDQIAERETALQAEQSRDRAEREQAFAVLESLVSEIERRRAG